MQCAPDSITLLNARDGARTAKIAGQWLGGCSVPRRAAELMLRNLTVRGSVACLLLPTHAQQIVTALSRIPPGTGLIVLAIDASFIGLARQCADFETCERAGRLFFAHDEPSLREIFSQNPGLPIPQQFIRLPVTRADLVDERVKSAQAVFSDVVQRQSTARSRIVWNDDSDRLCLLVSRQFKLWSDAGATLAGNLDADLIDLDDPRQTAPCFVAEKASRHAAMVTADHARSDQPDLLPANQPWIAWITQPRVPAFVPTSPRDGLLLADESLRAAARQVGWPEHRLAIAASPVVAPAATPDRSLALLADLPDLAPPGDVEEYSSWRVVWDAVRRELIDNPHRLAGDIDGYLEKARRHFGIPADNFPQQTFVDRLLAPTYAIGIARWLTREGVAIAVHGTGWTDVDAVSSQGPVRDRNAFADIVTRAAGLIDPFFAPVHSARRIGRPILTTFGRTPQRILQDAQAILAGRASATPTARPLDALAVKQLLAAS